MGRVRLSRALAAASCDAERGFGCELGRLDERAEPVLFKRGGENGGMEA